MNYQASETESGDFKNVNKRGSRCSVIEWALISFNHTHIFTDEDMMV